MSRLTAAMALAALVAAITPAGASAFGFLPGGEGFQATVRAEGGGPATSAGSHPYSLELDVGFSPGAESPGEPGVPFSDGDVRDLRLGMPSGLIVNPATLPECTLDAFNSPRTSPFEEERRSGEDCPANTQVGTVAVHSGGGGTRTFGLFNLAPPPGVPAQLGVAPYGTPIAFDLDVSDRGDGSYALSLDATNVSQRVNLLGFDLTIWGTPWRPIHDGERGDCLNEVEPSFPWGKCSTGEPAQRPAHAFLTLPAACGSPLVFGAQASSWQQPGVATASAASGGIVTGCDTLSFRPFQAAQLTSSMASSASGFRFILEGGVAGLTDPSGRAGPQVRRAVATLPDGVSVNPSVGAGLGVCTPAQYAAERATSAQGAGCPNAAKIGDFTVVTPLFPGEELEGAIYLAQPDDPTTAAPGAENPFDSLLAVYLVARSAERGILIKVAGRIDADPRTGDLTATFDQLPQLPYTRLEIHFRSGQRAPLVTPPSCGPATTQVSLTPWSGDQATVHASTDSQIESGIGGGACPTGATPPFSPGAVAGGLNSNVGSYTPYFVHLTRRDTEQEITSYSMTLPRGITAKLAGVAFCPDAAIEAARSRRGETELAAPSCPADSRIGGTLTGFGVGSALSFSSGAVYLAGPYHGSPLSVVTIDAATVGPFDLGTIVIRSAFEVDPVTAQLRIDSAGSDPIPHIIDGIPLRLRDIRIYVDRPEFTRNPTSCEPSQLDSRLTGSGARYDDPSDDSSASLSVRFQLLNCLTLGFRPKLGLRLRGGSRRGAYPALRAVYAPRPRDANLKRIAVTMPHSEFLAQNHIRKICTREQFAAEDCPAGSVYGHAVAYTPLFDSPLEGPVYLRSSSHRLPDLVAFLRWHSVRIVLSGRIEPAKHGIRVFFANLPDAPMTRFVLRMRGGRRGLLVNSTNICARPPLATVKALGHNNRGRIFRSKLRGRCDKRKPERGRGR